MNNLRDKFARFMQGRYGYDRLSRFLSVVIIVILLVGIFVRIPILTFIALALIIYSYYRMLSRNFSARSREEQAYLNMKGKFLSFFRNIKRRLTDRDHRYFRCPSCGKQLRVPKGKGNISIRCPHCHTSFTRRT